MTTFDLVQIQDFVASLDARMGPGLNGESASQTALDAALRAHGELCLEFTEQVRGWRQAVFTGRIEFDPAVETVVLAEGGAARRAGRGSLESRRDARTCRVEAHRPLRPAASHRTNERLAQALGPTEARRWPGAAKLHVFDTRDDRGRTPPDRRLAPPAVGLAVDRRPAPEAGFEVNAHQPVPLIPVPIALDSPEFTAILGWPFADSFVLRLLQTDIPSKLG